MWRTRRRLPLRARRRLLPRHRRQLPPRHQLLPPHRRQLLLRHRRRLRPQHRLRPRRPPRHRFDFHIDIYVQFEQPTRYPTGRAQRSVRARRRPPPTPRQPPAPPPAAAALPPCPPGPTGPTGVESSVGSINDVANQRFNQMITNRVLANVLLGINEQINCDDCVSAFGSAGSFSAGIHGRKNITPNLALLAGIAYAHYAKTATASPRRRSARSRCAMISPIGGSRGRSSTSARS